VASQLYQFHLAGEAREQVREAFPDLQIEELPPGLIARGRMIDESQLHGVLAELHAMGFTIVSVNPVPPDTPIDWNG
jgi:hypothetical protein